MRRVFWVFAALVVVFDSSPAILARTVEFQTIQVTTPDVALSPDGTTLIFTLAGHLFRLPAEGGTAEQLTFGPNYDSEPVFSPDGSQVAFTSDRDGSDGNIFLLRLEDRQVLQLTRQEHAGRPIWAPDGKAITYLIYSAFPGPAHLGPPALLARISLEGEKPETLSAEPKPIRSAFYLMDGRLAWSLIELDSQSSDYVTRIEAMAIDGTTVSLRTVRGMADCISSTPKGDGLYCQRLVGLDQWIPLEDGIVFVPLPSGSEREIGPISSGRRSLSRFDRSADGKSIYLGNEGRLWRVHPTGASEPISFHADVKLELQEITSPTRALVREDGSVRAILSPRLSPDGRTFVFGAAGFLWRQPLEEGKAQRIYHGEAMEGEPAFSPDGRQLAFVRTQHGTDSLLLLNLSGSQARILTTGPSISEVAWSPDGQRLVALVGVFDQSVMTFSVVDGKSAVIAPAGSWSPRPQLSSDGNWLYYSSDATGIGNLYRVKLSKDAKPEQITHFSRHLSDGRISSDSKWLVFHRNRTILVAPFGSKLIQDSDIRELSAEGGDTFELTPDSSSVIYSVGNSVWQQPLAGGPRKEIPVRLDISRSVPPPLLLRGVRVLHLASGTFSSETSLLLEHGHILWIGNESSHHLPPGVSIVDASGRFAIPGLFDLHAHSEGANAEAFLAYGVTSLRDTGGALSWLNAMQDRSEFTSNAAPRYFYSGEIFEGEHPLWGDAFLQITNEQEAREYVRQFQTCGRKLYQSLSLAFMEAKTYGGRRGSRARPAGSRSRVKPGGDHQERHFGILLGRAYAFAGI